jgi:hypothetical protein
MSRSRRDTAHCVLVAAGANEEPGGSAALFHHLFELFFDVVDGVLQKRIS